MKKIAVSFFITVFTISSLPSYGQDTYSRAEEIPVKIDGSLVKNPWAGGLNSCQFSEIDLDGDGIKDLFVFDRSGNKITTYINSGATGVVDYKFAPEYIGGFPDSLKNWVLLRDYNCDGKEDIFTHINSGIAVYRNDSDGDGIKFTLIKKLLYSGYNSPSPYNLYVSNVDIPAILDMDEDGDMDVVTFNIFGNFVELHLNNSQETYGHCDSLRYDFNTGCWGNFAEGLSGQIFLNQSCKRSNEGANKNGNSHAGSTMLVIDLNGDGAKDLLLADVDYSSVTKLVNGGTTVAANMTSFEYNYPASSTAVDLTLFPGSYYLDADNDGIKDWIISPNAANISENFTSVWFYKNQNRTDSGDFQFIQNDFIQNTMIDVGEGATPVLFDYNNDGKMDLLAGNYGYFVSSGTYTSGIALFENTGTDSTPEFELKTRDYANIASMNLRDVYPAFGDLDGDGDADMVIGEDEGLLHYFENTASTGSVPVYTLTASNYFAIDVGQSSKPQLMDINKDGKLDLLIGEQNGSINYIPNTGTVNVPDFNTGSMLEYFGSVDVKEGSSVTGFSVPFMFPDSTGELKLIVGSESGKLFYYDDIETDLTGSFNLVSGFYAGLKEGIRSAPAGYDMTNNGKMDLLIGNYAGGISFFENGKQGTISVNKIKDIPAFNLFPVPASNYIHVEFKPAGPDPVVSLTIYNLLGKAVKEEKAVSYGRSRIDIGELPEGIYLIKVESGAGQFNKKFIIRRN